MSLRLDDLTIDPATYDLDGLVDDLAAALAGVPGDRPCVYGQDVFDAMRDAGFGARGETHPDRKRQARKRLQAKLPLRSHNCAFHAALCAMYAVMRDATLTDPTAAALLSPLRALLADAEIEQTFARHAR